MRRNRNELHMWSELEVDSGLGKEGGA